MADEASPYIDLDGLKRAVGILDARYAGAVHAHGASDIEGLTALVEGRAPLHHAHKMDEVVGLKTSLAGKADNGHAHTSLASDALGEGADLDELDLHLGSPALSLAVAPAGAAHLPDGVEGPALVACELLRWAAEDDFASRQTLADPDGGAEWQRFCASGEWTAWARTYTTASMPTPEEIGAADRVHGHVVADVEGLRAELDGKAAAVHTHTVGEVESLQQTLDAKAPREHMHAMSDVTGLAGALAGKSDTGHLHEIADVVNLGSELAGKSPVTHGHDAATKVEAGFMSAADKVKLDGIADGATRVTAVSQLSNDMGYVNADQVAEAVQGGIAGMATQSWVEAKGYQTAAQVDAAVESKGYQTAAQVESAITAKGYDTAESVDGKVEDAKTELTAAIASAVSTVYRVKGSCARADLPGDPQTGDVWSLADEDGMNVVWTGSAWDELGVPVDLTWDAITGKPSAFAPSAHTHAQADVEGLSAALAGKSDTGHGHAVADVSGLQAALDSKAEAGHSHAVATAAAAGFLRQLDGSTAHYLRGDGSWAVPPNTTYGNATQSAAGLMSAADKVKLDGVATGANRYVHPSYTARASGLYKVAVDATGHVSGVAAVTKADITALGIPGAVGEDTDTTYTLTKSGSTIKLTGSDGSESSVTDSNTTYTLASFGVTATAAELNRMDGVTSNVQTQLNGKAASSHSHSYLPLSGGTLTGAVTHNAKNNRYSCSGGSWINGKTATNVPIVFPTASTMDGSRYDPYMWGQNSDGDVWNFGAGASNKVGFFGFNSGRTANGSDWSVYMNITTGRLTSTAGFTGALSGNATTATTLQTARTINGTSFNGGANITTANWGTARTLTIGSTGKSVNGSGNVSWSLSEIGAAAANHTHSGYAPVSHNHAASNITSGTLALDRLPTVSVAKGGTGATTAAQARTNLGITAANIGAAASSHNHSASNITSGTLAVARGGTGVTSDDALRQKVLNFPSSADLLDYLGL